MFAIKRLFWKLWLPDQGCHTHCLLDSFENGTNLFLFPKKVGIPVFGFLRPVGSGETDKHTDIHTDIQTKSGDSITL